MPRPCTLCGHPQRAAIDAALASGASLSAVVAEFGLPSRTAVQRHRAAHVGRAVTLHLPATAPSAAAPAGTSSDDEAAITALFDRALAAPERSLQDHVRVAFHEVMRLLASARGQEDRGFALRVTRELRALLQFASIIKVEALRQHPGWAEPPVPRDPIFAMMTLAIADGTGPAEEALAELEEQWPGFAASWHASNSGAEGRL